MNTSALLDCQLLATKFFVPVAPGPLISRPRLTSLLQTSLKHSLTLVSAPAGFGKTTLLAAWGQSLPASSSLLSWISLDEEDNEPRLFWISVLAALDRQRPQRFSSLLMELKSSQGCSLQYIVTALINLLADEKDSFVLILDDYQIITEQQIHTTLSYLLKHIPLQLHIILSTRADPPLPLVQLRACGQMLEVRTNQLRCTVEETQAFFHEVIGIQIPDEMLQGVTARIEGWLVGMQLLGLSLPEQANPATLLQEVSGDQRYILDYLTQEVLQHQSQEIQTFLLSTCILERLSASLCDAILQQDGSQQILQRLEQANLFVVSLDSKREWYRYHALFAQSLRYQLEQTYADLVPTLHYRASLWYATHDQSTQAIVHAFHAQQWEWAADLIEQKSLPLMALTWGASEHQLGLLQHWLKQLPTEVIGSRPRLCLTCTQLLLTVAPFSMLHTWLNAAETRLAASLTSQMPLQAQQEQKDLLGEVITWRAFQQSFSEHGETALVLCEQALPLLSLEKGMARALATFPQIISYYTSAANNAMASIEKGLQGSTLAQSRGHTTLAIILMGITAKHMIGAGRLHEAQQLTEQAVQLGGEHGRLILPDVGWPAAIQAELLREWNQLDAALSLAQEALALCQRTQSLGLLVYVVTGYAILLRISLSLGDLEAAFSALQQIERVCMKMNQPFSLYYSSFYTTTDQVRLWLACGDLDRATRWANELDQKERHGTLFAREREEVACARVLLAINQPTLALQRQMPVLQRATTGQRWSHVIETQLLQALAYQMLQQETEALSTLSEAVQAAEPEGYIRTFVDEGAPMAALLSRLREEQHKAGPTPYLDMLLSAFPQQSKERESQPKQVAERSIIQPLLDPLSERELQVLQLIAYGASNLEIAQKLVITYDTVKRHVSHIFSKLGVQNRIQAARRAQELNLI